MVLGVLGQIWCGLVWRFHRHSQEVHCTPRAENLLGRKGVSCKCTPGTRQSKKSFFVEIFAWRGELKVGSGYFSSSGQCIEDDD